MLCLSGFELYSRWVPLIVLSTNQAFCGVRKVGIVCHAWLSSVALCNNHRIL